ncbi:histidine phosphatase family protein [Jannaschia sp. CCS1]|uniref:histidine phosphatase family protein n=1 Tax=Jannaschia sp. (strain CCS1) TaxID=290400 RepID=UPI00006BFFAB|nr:histidine phosphatase family protein [Jannaschia sp. CCS1]ABD53821.1 Phosphoglycerate mutase [Jannaschia sp. CCS1]
MSRLFLIRHGPTHQTVFTGWRDVPADLSDTAAVARMRDHLPLGVPIISSDLIRCVATADAIAGGRLRLPHDRDLREFDFGAWDGLGFEEVGNRDPVLSRAFWDDPGDVTPPGGESWNDVATRVSAAITRHMAAHGDLIVVAHFGAILCQIGMLTGQTPKQIIAQKIDPLSVSEMRFNGTAWTLASVNHCP